MKKKILLLLLLQITIFNIYAQVEITLNEPLKIIATDKVNSTIKKGTTLFVHGVFYNYNDGYPIISVKAKNTDGIESNFETKKIGSFEFYEIDNIQKTWDKHSLISGTYANIATKGFQYDKRNELNNDAIDYINILSNNNLFFDDEYLEDYLYALVNKIHAGILKDQRPGNIYIKIEKNTEPNARALPNGCIIVTTGLLSTIQSEDELVGILAHEIAHFALDHHVLNYNQELDRKKRADFWSTFATVVAASADVYLSINGKNPVPGLLTATTAIAASTFSEEIVTKLGAKYNQVQEIESDKAAEDILSILKYNKAGLSAALQRIKAYCILTGNFLALSGTGSHPSLDSRINHKELAGKMDLFTQSDFLKKVSLINSYNANIELWTFSHHMAAEELATRNINNGIATESDYIVKAVVKRRLSNSRESNEEVLNLLNKAKALQVIPIITLYKEEGITYIRLGKMIEAKKSFETYLNLLLDLQKKRELSDNISNFYNEIEWTKKMIFKVGNL